MHAGRVLTGACNPAAYRIHPSGTYATSFTTAMENCEDESMLAAIGARIKHEVLLAWA